VVTPSHLLLVPSDSNKIINLLNFNDIGINSLNESNAFKKIRAFSKTNNTDLFSSYSKFNSKFYTFSKFANSETDVNDFPVLSGKRQFSFLSATNLINNPTLSLDVSAFKKLIKLNFKSNISSRKNFSAFFEAKTLKNQSDFSDTFSLNNNFFFFQNSKNYFDYLLQINNDSDKKKIQYPFLKLLNSRFFKNSTNRLNSYEFTNKLNFDSDFFFSNVNQNSFFNFLNENKFNKNFDVSSSNQSFLFANRNIRSLTNLKANNTNLAYSTDLNNVLSQYSSLSSKFELNPYFFYKLNLLK